MEYPLIAGHSAGTGSGVVEVVRESADEDSPLQSVEQLHGLDVALPVCVRGSCRGVAGSLT